MPTGMNHISSTERNFSKRIADEKKRLRDRGWVGSERKLDLVAWQKVTGRRH